MPNRGQMIRFVDARNVERIGYAGEAKRLHEPMTVYYLDWSLPVPVLVAIPDVPPAATAGGPPYWMGGEDQPVEERAVDMRPVVDLL